jgi:hypothetical protein
MFLILLYSSYTKYLVPYLYIYSNLILFIISKNIFFSLINNIFIIIYIYLLFVLNFRPSSFN